MFTRQHYKAIAKILTTSTDHVSPCLVDDFCRAFKADNELFKERLFREYIAQLEQEKK